MKIILANEKFCFPCSGNGKVSHLPLHKEFEYSNKVLLHVFNFIANNTAMLLGLRDFMS
jgi:hypothetical protein